MIMVKHMTKPIDIIWSLINIHVFQCPIDPNTSFKYVFKAEKSGTYWYHSHIGTQISEGLVGPLIVKKGNETMREHVLMIQVGLTLHHFLYTNHISHNFTSYNIFIIQYHGLLDFIIQYETSSLDHFK